MINRSLVVLLGQTAPTGRTIAQGVGEDPSLLPLGLIDEFRVWIFPSCSAAGALKLVESQTSSTGVLITFYQPAGEIPKGSFALAEPTEAELRRREGMREE